MKYRATLSILAGAAVLAAADADQDAAPLDANGHPFPAVWVQVASTSYYCYADNCARAVTGTRTAADMPPQSVRQADCTSYMHTTETPAPVTTTTTVTVTASQGKRKRDAAVTAAATRGPPPALQVRAAATIPTYASFCTESFPGATPHYSSACNCWSITASTTTLAPTTVTVTSTATATPAAPTACTDPKKCGTFATHYCPGSGSTEYCYCVKDTSGAPTCYHFASGKSCESFAKCTSNAQCAAGTSCSTDWCCGYGICMDHTSAASCPNPQAARSIFARKQAARDAVAVAAVVPDDNEDEDVEGGEVAAAAAAATSVITSVIMCPHGPCGTTTITAASTTTTPPPAKATPMAFAARRRGNDDDAGAVEAAAISVTTSTITCPHGICGSTTITATVTR